MAVLCPAGENSINFVYQPDGIRLSRPLTLGGIVGVAGVHGLLRLAQTPHKAEPDTGKNDFVPQKKEIFAISS